MSCSPAPIPADGDHGSAPFAVQFHLLGCVDWADCQRLQRRLVYEAGSGDDGRIVTLLCEHPPLISVGRRGSRGHIRCTNEQLRHQRLEVRWVNRGGGCVLHAPGQLAIYPIVPLAWHGWTVGSYLQRLQRAVLQTLQDFRVSATTYAPWAGVWGRSGQLAACGVAVRDGITCHGAFLNVNPAMSSFQFVDVVDPLATHNGQKSTMGSLFAERRQALSAAGVRAALIPHLAASFGTDRYHIVTGHPLLTRPALPLYEATHRAS
ncbi:MAG: lipoyl(octanoyl) transferase [Planctomycetaceae bacterium]|nr:lipoyl(octanoyl) transferase [Planctomycetaceae bacterium]